MLGKSNHSVLFAETRNECQALKSRNASLCMQQDTTPPPHAASLNLGWGQRSYLFAPLFCHWRRRLFNGLELRLVFPKGFFWIVVGRTEDHEWSTSIGGTFPDESIRIPG